MIKLIRRICAFFISFTFMLSVAPLVFAEGVTTKQDLVNYWVHIKESGTWVNDLIRNASWGILKAMSELINYIQQAITEVLHWNLYDRLKKLDPSFDIRTGSVKALILAILVVAAVFAGLLIIINGDKMHIKDSVKNILIAVCLVGAMPALLDGLDDFMFSSNGYAASYSLSGEQRTSEDTVKLLGDTILAQQVYDNVVTVDKAKGAPTGTQYTLYNSGKFDAGTMPRDLNINQLAKQSEIDKKYAGSTTSKRQTKFSELNMENCVSLLDMSKEYATLKRVKGMFKEGEKFSYKLPDRTQGDATVEEFEALLIKRLVSKQYQTESGTIKVQDDKNINMLKKDLNGDYIGTFEQAVEIIKDDTIRELNYLNNVNNALGDNANVSLKSLRTQKEYDKMGWITQAVTVDIWEPNEDERVYAYDYDFFPTFIDMCIIIVCLVFALLKLCRMLWEIAFMHIFVPLVVATDAHGAGRAKRAIQHLISTFAILIVILITLKLYISLISDMHSIKNLIARWGLILAGAHFVIDGSDFIVKMTGMDAGVKSGAATLLGLRSAAGLAVGAGRTAANVGGKVAHVGAKVGGKAAAIGGTAANHAGGAVVGAVAGLASGGIGGGVGGASGHDSRAGNIAGGAVGATTGAATGAVRGGAEGARRGLTGLFRRDKGNNQSAESGTTTSASGGSSQAASSDTGTAAAPTPSSSDADGVVAADTPSVESGGSVDSASTPEVDGGNSAGSGEREREGTIFTRAYSAGRTVGGATGHPINTGKQAAWKVGSTKAKYDIAKTDGTIKDKMNGKLNDFVKGRYKDNNNGNGGNS